MQAKCLRTRRLRRWNEADSSSCIRHRRRVRAGSSGAEAVYEGHGEKQPSKLLCKFASSPSLHFQFIGVPQYLSDTQTHYLYSQQQQRNTQKPLSLISASSMGSSSRGTYTLPILFAVICKSFPELSNCNALMVSWKPGGLALLPSAHAFGAGK